VDGEPVAHADLGARRPRLPRIIFALLPREVPIREIELGASESLLSGFLSLGIFAVWGVPRPTSMRIFVGALAGFAIGAAVWIFGVSQPRLGLRILLECVGAALVVAMSIETVTERGEPAPTIGRPVSA
jgi:hypothetical protein